MTTLIETADTCLECLEEFVREKPWQVYCKDKCRQRAYRKRVTHERETEHMRNAPKRPTSVLTAPASNHAIKLLLEVHFPQARTAIDATCGKGVFWKGLESTVDVTGCDIDPTRARHAVADCQHLPFAGRSFDLGVLDLPFMHDPGANNGHKMFGCYSGMGTWERFVEMTVAGARELQRVCRQGMIIKAKDGIERGQYRPIVATLIAQLGPPWDVLVFVPQATLPHDPKWVNVHHLRRQESYFLVYKHKRGG